MGWLGKSDEDRFIAAIRETRLAAPELRGRRKKTQLPSGLVRTHAYLSPNEHAALRELADSEGVSLSVALRALIRTFREVDIDGSER